MRKLALSFVLAVRGALAADVTGTWQFDVQTDQGSGTPTFVLRQRGEELTGSYSGALGQAQVRGSVKGEEMIIEFDTDAAGEKMTVRYTGKLEGESRVSGKVTLGPFGGTFTGTKK
jgi:hypothetical protein